MKDYPLPQYAGKPRSTWVMVVTLVLLLLIVVLMPLAAYTAINTPSPLTASKTVVIPHGTSVRDMARLLAENGVISRPIVFKIAARVVAHNLLKSGEYEFTPGQSASDMARMLHDGRSVAHWFKVAEGLTSADIIRMLASEPAMKDRAPVPPEGSLLPETYRYSFGDSRIEMVKRMQKSMQDTLADLWSKRDAGLPLKSPEEAIILASVIEKETGKSEERPRIAGVFYNRLRQNMRLQSDPTVVYAIEKAKGTMDRDLQRGDLAFPSPINTYASDGIPSQPICNPGRAALEAALHPEKNDYLYFVASGTGGHSFARTLDEHNRNVARYRKMQN